MSLAPEPSGARHLEIRMKSESPNNPSNESRDYMGNRQSQGSKSSSRTAAPHATEDPNEAMKHAASTSNGDDEWLRVYTEYKTIDEDRINQTDGYIDTLLVFAGLFSAVLTAFLVEVYTELKPDNTQLTAPILLDISNQLYAISLGKPALAANVSLVQPSTLHSPIVTTSLWFISLAISLGAALFGILVKQWLREYMRWTTIFPLQDAIYIRYHRSRDLDNWKVEGIVTVISGCLVIGLMLFLLGLALLLWQINETTAQVATFSVGLVLIAAIITTVLPAFISGCPYRTSIALFLRNTLSPLLRIFIFIGIVAYSVASAFIRQSLSRISARNYNSKTWLNRLKILQSLPPSMAYKSWISFDTVYRFPGTYNDPNKTAVVDKCASLSWLTRHRSVPKDVVTQCLLNVLGTAPTLPKNLNDDFEWMQDDIHGAGDYVMIAPQFRLHCQALLGVVRNDNIMPKWIQRCYDFDDLLDKIFPFQTYDANRRRLLPTSSYDDYIISLISTAIQRADRQSQNVISAYFFSWAEIMLDPPAPTGQAQVIDFELVAKLVRILFLLWRGSEYSERRNRDNSDPSLELESSGQSHYLLKKAFAKLLEQSLQNQDPNYLFYHDSIVRVLTSGSTFSFVDYLEDSMLNGHAIQNIMESTKRFVNDYKEGLSLFQSNNIMLSPFVSKEIYQGEISRFSYVFWGLTAPVFRSDVLSHLEISDNNHKEFLDTIQTVLKAEIQATIEHTKFFDRLRRQYMVPYILRHRSHLPTEFVYTLEEAKNKGVIDLEPMLELSRRSSTVTITRDLGIHNLESFWAVLKNQPETQASYCTSWPTV